METLTLTRVFRKSIETKKGPAVKVGVKATEYGDTWLSCFENAYTKDWEEGKKVEVVEVKQNGQWHNIVLPKNGSNGNGGNDQVMKELKYIRTLLEHLVNNKPVPSVDVDAELQPDEGLPF